MNNEGCTVEVVSVSGDFAEWIAQVMDHNAEELPVVVTILAKRYYTRVERGVEDRLTLVLTPLVEEVIEPGLEKNEIFSERLASGADFFAFGE